MMTKFSAVLTGAPDGLSDLDLRTSSLNMTLRESTSCFASLIIDPAQLDEVNLRPNGTIKIYKTKDSGAPTLLVTFNQSDIRIDSGAFSSSIRLTGTTSASFTPFDTVPLYKAEVITDRLLSDGRKAWQVDPSLDIMPGDTVNYYETATPDAYVIDIVTVVANGKQSQVTITEA